MGRTKRMQQYDVSIPPKEYRDPEARALWSETDPALRREIVRMTRELSEGTAIVKDRRCGRRTCDPAGFYGLERAERELYEAEAKGAPAADIAALKDSVDLLRHGLASDIAFFESMEALEPYHQYAADQGKTLAQYLDEMSQVERTLRDDPIGGVFLLCDRVGAEPLQVMAQLLAQPQQQVAH